MADPLGLALATSAGGCVACAALVLLGPGRVPGAREWLDRRRRPAAGTSARSLLRRVTGAAAYGTLRARLAGRLERAGMEETPEVAVGFALVAIGVAGVASAAVVAFVSDPATGLVGGLVAAIVAAALLVQRLGAAVESRRQRLLAQLGPILELVSLELSGGAPPMLALEAVLARSGSELARAMRAQLIGSRVAGSTAFDNRLDALGERLDLQPLHAMAMILGLSRDYGSGVGQGVRALAADLRRSRRRRVIELSRGALNRVLIPAAVGVLLPFMAVLLFPAVAVLLRSFA